MFKNLLLEEAEDNWSSGGHDEGDIQVSISDFDSPKVNIQKSKVQFGQMAKGALKQLQLQA